MNFPFDLSKLDIGAAMDMVRKVQTRMAEVEAELRRTELETEVGGGMLKVRANAAGELTAVEFSAEALAMNDPAVLSSLVLSGVNQALQMARARREEEQRKASAGMLPGLGSFLP
mgnify:CR=1 FL=1